MYRDLKPENIFINDNVFKIGDFGLSKINENDELNNTFVGTPKYQSP